MSKSAGLCALISSLFLAACGPPKSDIPALNPQEAGSLLHYNNKAENWMIYVRKTNPSCEYTLDLPDQSSHPPQIDLDHIVTCGGRPSPREFDASVSFAYDPDQKRWVVKRFSS
ncbi:MAG: hypothetical protein JO319_00020 [Acidobacteriaceae bacterium]|nr:hypothetical protein [Acidobacteriaceae bacterium]